MQLLNEVLRGYKSPISCQKSFTVQNKICQTKTEENKNQGSDFKLIDMTSLFWNTETLLLYHNCSSDLTAH